jgi:hypothetical protein
MAIPVFVWAIGALVASYAISSLITPSGGGEPAKPGSLEDFNFPQVEEGTSQMVIFGDVIVEDYQILWYGNLRTEPVKSEGVSK